jgi:hypothetical protein
VLDETPFRQLARGVLTDLLAPPVVRVIDETLLVVKQRVEHYQARQFTRMLCGVVAADAATETRTQQRDPPSAGLAADAYNSGTNIAEDARKCQILLTTFALAMAPQVEAQRCYSGLSQPGRQADEEATLLASDSATMNEDDRLASTVWRDERGGEPETIWGGEHGHD